MSPKILSWQGFGILLAGVLILAIPAGMYFQSKQDDWAAPNQDAMKAFRVARMSDGEILILRGRANADSARFKELDSQSRDAYWKDKAERDQKCADVVFKTRNESLCNQGVALGMLSRDERFTPSAETLFQDYLLGHCKFVDTREQARADGCLPPK
ncbi:MAG: hypothetical protein AB1342_06560 [Pseudomonadota bacterium]